MDVTIIQQNAPAEVVQVFVGPVGPAGPPGPPGSILEPVPRIRFDTINPGSIEQEGDLAWDDVDRSLAFQLNGNIQVDIPQELIVYVRNPTGSTTIPKGAAVAVNGASANRLRIKLCDAAEGGDGCATIGVALENIGAPDFGFVSTFGLIRDFNTNNIIGGGVAPGVELYISTMPGVLSTQPAAPPGRRVTIGYVVTTGNEGSIFVTVRRGLRVSEIDNVFESGTPSQGHVLAWNATNGRYEVGGLPASAVTYNNASSGLTATNVQDAIDELKALITPP